MFKFEEKFFPKDFSMLDLGVCEAKVSDVIKKGAD